MDHERRLVPNDERKTMARRQRESTGDDLAAENARDKWQLVKWQEE